MSNPTDIITVEKFKRKDAAAPSKWRQKLIANKQGIPKGILANAITAFRFAPEWQGVLAFDTFALATQVKHAPPWEGTGPVERAWSPLDDVLAATGYSTPGSRSAWTPPRWPSRRWRRMLPIIRSAII
jgi:hypothetical protein